MSQEETKLVSVRAPKSRTSTYSLEALLSVMSGNHQTLAYKSARWHSFILQLFDVGQINNRCEIAVSVTSCVNENYCSHLPILSTKKQISVPVKPEPGKLQQHSITSRALAGFWSDLLPPAGWGNRPEHDRSQEFPTETLPMWVGTLGVLSSASFLQGLTSTTCCLWDSLCLA